MDKKKYIYELIDLLYENKKSKRYILACCNYASKLIDSNLPVIFDVKHLALLIGMAPSDLGKLIFLTDVYYYHEISIPKKAGGTRILSIPAVDLKYIQRWILKNVLCHMHISDIATGFVNSKSILTNAHKHTNKDCVINLDIKDFFPSITLEQVFMIFKYYGYTKELAYAYAKLCTHKGVLPQGSPASPYITNIICLKLDKRLYQLAKKYEAEYTRYADDITFSGGKGLPSILYPAQKIIMAEGFSINRKKTRISYRHQRQEVTGLIVNQSSVKVPRSYKRELQKEIYYCKRFGVTDHQLKIGDFHSFYKEHLFGKAYYIKMIEPKTGEKFLSQLNEIEWEY